MKCSPDPSPGPSQNPSPDPTASISKQAVFRPTPAKQGVHEKEMWTALSVQYGTISGYQSAAGTVSSMVPYHACSWYRTMHA